MICTNFSTFRLAFSQYAAASISGTFDAAAKTIVRALGDYVANGFLAGHVLDVTGTANNDGRYTIASVATTTLTLVASDTLANEGPVACALFAVYRDADGLERWPVALVRTAGDFGALGTTITGIPTPYLGVQFTVTCNAGAADGTPGTDMYDWYLSQRSDTAGAQYLLVTPYLPVGPNTYSGSVQIVHGTLAVSGLGLTTPPSPQVVVDVFKHCHLYVQRRSDKAIQWCDLLRSMVASWPA